MTLLDGAYRIRNYQSKNHVVLRHRGDNLVACNGHFAEGDIWHVNCLNRVENNWKYHIQNYDKKYSATCDPKAREEGNVCARENLEGVPVPVWLIKKDDKGKPVTDQSVTYT
ncbi:hypothetical protein BD410DRAFT_396525 [Rickenella mellea]|uniref:Ricin B lectin domain-containing protein n=1 Tax=Rickenella mellea TaxID=50990 RepID=A0A4Y7PXB8_9AGAM|nr:hypothetical protein BD410DRAFT_396525 [Rickenella mellea]